MKILDWEKNITGKFKVDKIEDFDELRYYLSNPNNYADCFTPSEITEGEIEDDEFYSAYAFDEHEILKKDVIAHSNSGWATTVVFIGSINGKDLDKYFIHGLNGFTRENVQKFLDDLMLGQDCSNGRSNG